MPRQTIETFGDLIDNHHGVGAWCPAGHGFRPVDISVLVAPARPQLALRGQAVADLLC